MTPWVKILIVALLLGAGFTTGVKWDANAKGKVIANLNLEMEKERVTWKDGIIAGQNETLAEISTNDTTKAKLKEKENEANAALNYLLEHPVGRVLIPRPCVSASQGDTTGPAGSSAVSPAATERADNPAQQAFDDFTRGVESDAAEWSRAFNACSEVNEWVKHQ